MKVKCDNYEDISVLGCDTVLNDGLLIITNVTEGRVASIFSVRGINGTDVL